MYCIQTFEKHVPFGYGTGTRVKDFRCRTLPLHLSCGADSSLHPAGSHHRQVMTAEREPFKHSATQHKLGYKATRMIHGFSYNARANERARKERERERGCEGGEKNRGRGGVHSTLSFLCEELAVVFSRPVNRTRLSRESVRLVS